MDEEENSMDELTEYQLRTLEVWGRIADALEKLAAKPAEAPRAAGQQRQGFQQEEPRRSGDGKKPNWWGMLYHRAKNAGYDSSAMAQEAFNVSDSRKLTVAQVKTLLDKLPNDDEQI